MYLVATQSLRASCRRIRRLARREVSALHFLVTSAVTAAQTPESTPALCKPRPTYHRVTFPSLFASRQHPAPRHHAPLRTPPQAVESVIGDLKAEHRMGRTISGCGLVMPPTPSTLPPAATSAASSAGPGFCCGNPGGSLLPAVD
jgi:hypothetical protein